MFVPLSLDHVLSLSYLQIIAGTYNSSGITVTPITANALGMLSGQQKKYVVFRQVKSGRVITNSAEEFSVAAYESVSSIATLFQKEKICSASQMTSPSTPETLQIHKFVWSSTAEGGRIIALCFLSNGKESSHTQSYLERTCSHVVKEYVTSALFLLLCANCMKKYLEQNEAEDGFMKSASNCSHYVI